MKQIPRLFGKSGYDYELVDRGSHFAIYKQKQRGTGGVVAFEVHRIRHRTFDKTSKYGSWKKGDEYLASAAEWGRHGWTLVSEIQARAKVIELERNARNKQKRQEEVGA